jgi:hypothetical protein
MPKKFWIGLALLLSLGLGSAFYLENQNDLLKGSFSVNPTASTGYYAYLSPKTEDGFFLSGLTTADLDIAASGESSGSLSSIKENTEGYYELKFSQKGSYQMNLNAEGYVSQRNVLLQVKNVADATASQDTEAINFYAKELTVQYGTKILLENESNDPITEATVTMGEKGEVECFAFEEAFLCPAPLGESNYQAKATNYLPLEGKFLIQKRSNPWDDQEVRSLTLKTDPSSVKKEVVVEEVAVEEPVVETIVETVEVAEPVATEVVEVVEVVEVEEVVETCTHPFTDVQGWYEDSMCWAYEKGFITGTSATTASPLKTTNWAQGIVLMVRASGDEESSKSADLETNFFNLDKSAWYAPHVKWAESKGWISGTSFNGVSPMTRADFIQVMAKAAGKTYYNFTASELPDDVRITDDYAWAVALAMKDGVATGRKDGSFEPFKNLNRAEMSSFLYRAFEAKWF